MDQDRAAQVWKEAWLAAYRNKEISREDEAAQAIIAAYGQERFRAGIKALYNNAVEYSDAPWWLDSYLENRIKDLIGVEETEQLFAEQEKG